jgi:hypothetical protein
MTFHVFRPTLRSESIRFKMRDNHTKWLGCKAKDQEDFDFGAVF